MLMQLSYHMLGAFPCENSNFPTTAISTLLLYSRVHTHNSMPAILLLNQVVPTDYLLRKVHFILCTAYAHILVFASGRLCSTQVDCRFGYSSVV